MTVINFVLEDYSSFTKDSKSRIQREKEDASKTSQAHRRGQRQTSSSSSHLTSSSMDPRHVNRNVNPPHVAYGTVRQRIESVPSKNLEESIVSRLPSEGELVKMSGKMSLSKEYDDDYSVDGSIAKHMSSSDYSIGLQSTKHSAVASLTDVYKAMSRSGVRLSCDCSVESSLKGSFGAANFEWDSDMEDDEDDPNLIEYGTGSMDPATTISLLKKTMVMLHQDP